MPRSARSCRWSCALRGTGSNDIVVEETFIGWSVLPEGLRPHQQDCTRVVCEGLDELSDQRAPHRVLTTGCDLFYCRERSEYLGTLRRMLKTVFNPLCEHTHRLEGPHLSLVRLECPQKRFIELRDLASNGSDDRRADGARGTSGLIGHNRGAFHVAI